jgi:hypothetical protein
MPSTTVGMSTSVPTLVRAICRTTGHSSASILSEIGALLCPSVMPEPNRRLSHSLTAIVTDAVIFQRSCAFGWLGIIVTA